MHNATPQIREIYCQALEYAPGTERDSYLRSACGEDAALRKQVKELLDAQSKVGQFLGGTVDVEIGELTSVGDSIGPYKLREKIGEGGFGVVYAAEQKEPVRRKVALKVIKLGMDSKDIVARFEAERQALAMMDHPNVAKVLDAGATESGRPYFVMELVHGISITEFCDSRRLSNRQRLKLFIDVCHAVQHAHQKGIIHRDLKPSNVMVTMADHRPIVKVIDFGVAKALHQNLTDKSIYTGYGQMVGTPMYMSPEQAQLSSLDVDTRSDIYSLGVMLYELLTGTTPFDQATFKQAGLDEIRRMIREVEPRRPSDRVSTLRAELQSTISEKRNIEPGTLSRSLRGDLDWIVMKTLEKDRNRRYETANGLSADLQRFLIDEPVLACPPSIPYKLRKFARRNKVAMGFASLSSVFVVAGIVGLLMSNHLISQRDRERSLALIAAGENFQQARSAVDKYLTLVSEETLLERPSMQPLRKQLLELALAYYEEFAVQQSNNPDLQKELSDAYFRAGMITSLIGTPKNSIAAHQKAHEIRARLASNDPDDFEIHRDLALSLQELGRLYFQTHDYDDGERHLEQAVQLFHQLASNSPENDEVIILHSNCLGHLGSCLKQANPHRLSESDEKYATIKSCYDRGIQVCNLIEKRNPNHAQLKAALARNYHGLGLIQNEVGLAKKSLESHETAIELQRQFVNQYPTDLKARHNLASYYYAYGFAAYYDGNKANGIKQVELAVDVSSTMVNENPAVSIYKRNLRASYYLLARISTDLNRDDDTLTYLQKTMQVDEALVILNPTPHNKFNLSKTLFRLGEFYAKTMDHERAEQVLNKGVKISRELYDSFPGDRKFGQALVGDLSFLATLSRQDQNNREILLREATPVSKKVMLTNPDRISFSNFTVCSLKLSELLKDQRKYPEAERILDDAVLNLEKMAGSEYGKTILTKTAKSDLLVHQGRYHESLEILSSVLDYLRPAVEQDNFDQIEKQHEAKLYLSVAGQAASCLRALNRNDDALQLFRSRFVVARRANSRWPKTLFFRIGLAASSSDLGGQIVRQLMMNPVQSTEQNEEATKLIETSLQYYTELSETNKLDEIDEGIKKMSDHGLQVALLNKSLLLTLEGSYASAMDPLEKLVSQDAVHDGLWLEFAETFLVCSIQQDSNSKIRDESTIRRCQDLTVHCLRRASDESTTSPFELEKLLDDPDLMTLQNRPEFRSTLERIKAIVEDQAKLSVKEH